MRKHLLWASATLALITACGGSSSPASGSSATACVDQGAAHHAYVVVEHMSGATLQRCVGFDGAQISGDDLMTKSGITFSTQTFSGLGKAVCQIDSEPAQFTECFPKGKPYWALSVETNGGAWADAQTGYTAIELKDGDALGWEYVSPTASPAPLPRPKK